MSENDEHTYQELRRLLEEAALQESREDQSRRQFPKPSLTFGGRPASVTQTRHPQPSSARPLRKTAPATPPPTEWHTIDLQKLSLAELEKLFVSAEAGDADAMGALEKFIKSDGSAVWRQAGNLAAVAEKALLTTVFNKSSSLALAGRRKFADLRATLAADDATPLEQLAIERVVLAFMFASAIDTFVAMQGPEGLTSAKQIQAQQLAERRLNAALKSLKIAREISRAAIAGPLRLFGARPRNAETPRRAATA